MAVGLDLSNFTTSGAALVLSPASLVQLPVTVVPPVSPMIGTCGEHVTGLLIESEPDAVTVTSVVYQPLVPAVPAVTASAAEGPVLSILTVIGLAVGGQTGLVGADAADGLPGGLVG